MTDTFRALCADLLDELIARPLILDRDLIARARDALSSDEPAVPEGREPASVTGEPSDAELDLLVIAIQALTPHQPDATTHNLAAVNRGRELLRDAFTRFSRPTPVPVDELMAAYRSGAADAAKALEPVKHVPVSERPWERKGWCDENGRCWFGAPQDGAADAGWLLRKPSERLSHQIVSLPAEALPLPSGEVEE